MMLDMEDQSFTDATIALHNELRAAGLPVALTLQAYLRRTEADLEPPDRARRPCASRQGRLRRRRGDELHADATRSSANSRRLIDLMFSRRARDSGFYPSIASHDDALQRYAAKRAEANSWPADTWEIEMLLGVRDDARRCDVAELRPMRLYLPFCCDLWPYAILRIGETPANASLLTRSLISR